MKTKLSTKPCLMAAVLMLLFSYGCNKPEENEGGITYSDVPFDKISVMAEGETVEGVVDGLDILFTFDIAEDYSAAKLILTVNDGWALTYPVDPDNYNMTDDPDIYFKNPQGGTVKYDVTFISNSIPIVDPSKISVTGGYAVNVNNGTKEIEIIYSSSMDRSNVELVIGEGALMEGATVEGSTVFDLSDGNGVLNIKMNGINRPYTVKINYSAIMANPAVFGLKDVTSDYISDEGLKASVTVLKGNSLSGVPVKNNTTKVDQAWWDCDQSSVNAQRDVLAALGDYTSDRAKTSIDVSGFEFTVVTFDADKFKGAIASDSDYKVSAEDFSNFIILSGSPYTEPGNNATYVNEILVLDRTVVNYIIPWGGGKNFRACVGFDDNGNMDISNATAQNGKLQQVPYFIFNNGDYSAVLTDNNLLPRSKWSEYIGADWNMKNAVSTRPVIVRDGYRVKYQDVYINEGYEEKMGERWMGTEFRSYIGKTYDGKIGLCVATGAKAINTLQGAYVLAELGWKDVVYFGGSQGGAESFQPTIIIDGKVVAGQKGQQAICCAVFDKK